MGIIEAPTHGPQRRDDAARGQNLAEATVQQANDAPIAWCLKEVIGTSCDAHTEPLWGPGKDGYYAMPIIYGHGRPGATQCTQYETGCTGTQQPCSP